MKFIKAFFVTSALAMVMIMATQALAKKPEEIVVPPPPGYDIKSYPATACQPSPMGVATFQQGHICNPDNSTVELNLNCPIVRDDVVEGDDTLILVNVAQYLWPVECTAYSLDQGYGVIDEVNASQIVYGETTLLLTLEETESDGYYSLSCMLPEDSCFFGYRVYEWEDGDYEMTTDYNR